VPRGFGKILRGGGSGAILGVSRVSQQHPYIQFSLTSMSSFLPSKLALERRNGIVSTCSDGLSEMRKGGDRRQGRKKDVGVCKTGGPCLKKAFRDGPHAQYLSQHGSVLLEM
jgi:hypothetical protein